MSVCLQALREELEQHKVRTLNDASVVSHVFRRKRFIFMDFYSKYNCSDQWIAFMRRIVDISHILLLKTSWHYL